jgi:multiple sugar transport system ATP-binding protein
VTVASITLQDVRKAHGRAHLAVRDLTLHVNDGELMVLVGPSGSGKSTVLRLIAGLDTPTVGRILIDGRDVADTPPQQRDLAMVFQSYALYPHLTVRDNLSFPLRMRRLDKASMARKVSEVAAALGLEPLLARKPAQLSGGERQRVALGRAIVREPRGFLLDEPLSNLDPDLRGQTRAELSVLHRRLRATMVYVTHDQEEAMTLGTRIAVLRGGVLEQLGAPMDVYRWPANAFVAGFIGSPAMNLLRGSSLATGRGVSVVAGPLTVPMGDAPAPGVDGEPILLGIRPQDIDIVPEAAADVVGRVELVERLGATTLVHARLADAPALRLRVVVAADVVVGLEEVLPIRIRRDRLHIFDAATGVRRG